MKVSRVAVVVAALMVVLCTSQLASSQTTVGDAAAEDIFGNRFARCRVLKLDGPEFDPDPVTGEYPRLDEAPWSNILAAVGISIRATDKSGTQVRRPIIFPTQPPGPTGGDTDLGTPNRACGSAPEGPQPNGQTISPLCYQENSQSLPASAVGFIAPFQKFSGNNYYNCSGNPGGCPGIGCGGDRWRTTNPNSGGTCIYQTALTDVVLLDDMGGVTVQQVLCPIPNPNANCVPQGNVMVIHERRPPNNQFNNPDDDANGGRFIVEWNTPVFVVSAAILDMEERSPNAGFIEVFSRNGDGTYTSLGSEDLIVPGDNGFQIDTIRRENVDRMVVQLTGSGSLNDIVWCEGEAEITLNSTWTRECDWTITKEVNQDNWHLLIGEATDEQYEVTVSNQCQNTFEVCGSGTVNSLPGQNFVIEEVRAYIDPNPDDRNSDVVVSVTDCVCNGGSAPAQACTPSSASPITLSPLSNTDGSCLGEFCSITCNFCANVATRDSQRVIIDFLAAPGSATGDVDLRSIVSFSSSPDEAIDTTAVVTDSENSFPPRSLDESEGTVSITFTASHPCDRKDQPDSRFNCTASVREDTTGETSTDETSVFLRCSQPAIGKNGRSYFEREWSWTVDKSGSSQQGTNPSGVDRTDVRLSTTPDGSTTFASADVDYSFAVTAQSEDSNHRVDGDISVSNPHPTRDMVGASLSDVYQGFPATIQCDGVADVTSFTIPASSTIDCTYSVALDGKVSGQNSASLSFAGFEFEASFNVQFDANAPNSTACGTARLTDQFNGNAQQDVETYNATGSAAGTVNFPAASLSRTFLPLTCPTGATGEATDSFGNTARVFCGDSGLMEDSDDWLVRVVTPCELCPCEYRDYPADPMFMDSYDVDVTGSSAGVCLCWNFV